MTKDWRIRAKQKVRQVKILAVTSCPDRNCSYLYGGRRHLRRQRKRRDCYIKIETRGSGGAKNVLTAKGNRRGGLYYRSSRCTGSHGSDLTGRK